MSNSPFPMYELGASGRVAPEKHGAEAGSGVRKRSAAIATHIVRRRKTPARPASAPSLAAPPNLYPQPVVTVRRSAIHFGPGGKAILILAALSVIAVIISTILTQT